VSIGMRKRGRRINMKLICKIVKNCDDCPYEDYNADYGMSYDSGYNCKHPKVSKRRIVDDNDFAVWKKKKENKNKLFPIPDWCPLPDAEED
jgi:hypothetical protein